MNLIQKTDSDLRIAVFDLDGTIINSQSQLLFLKFLINKNIISYFSVVPLLIWFLLYKLNLVSNPNKAFDYALKIFKKINYNDLSNLATDFVKSDDFKKTKNKKVIQLLEKHQKNGDLVILLSTAINIITEKVAKSLGINHCISSKLEKENDFPSNIKIVNGQSKLVELEKFLNKNNLPTDNIYAYGDDISDLPVFMYAKYKIAVNPSPKLKKYTKDSNWNII